MWQIKLHCINCDNKELTSKGLYNRIRDVVDTDCQYYMAAEYLECRACKKTYISWSQDILKQLDPGHRLQFPAILTYKKACDVKVMTLLRSRTLGNSATVLRNSILELHSETWLKQVLLYLTDCEQHKKKHVSGVMRHLPPPVYQPPPNFTPIPTYQWVLGVYSQDVLSRLDEVKAQITSVYGQILKMDSTKKIAKKLAGESSGTAAWATNVGNEYGQVLMSVLTCTEGTGLEKMAKGLVKRYSEANETPPLLLYVDRDCCVSEGIPQIKELFSPWDIKIRLDVWHFMRRFSVGCTTCKLMHA